jgi:hypothetical protein
LSRYTGVDIGFLCAHQPMLIVDSALDGTNQRRKRG